MSSRATADPTHWGPAHFWLVAVLSLAAWLWITLQIQDTLVRNVWAAGCSLALLMVVAIVLRDKRHEHRDPGGRR